LTDKTNLITAATIFYSSRMTTRKKLIRITTVPMALRYLLNGQMRFMKEQGFEVLMISADGRERAEVIANEQCPHLVVPMTRRITPFRDLRCLWQLIRIFRREKPDIVHTHTPKAGLLGMLAARISGIKIRIHTVAGLPLMVETGFKRRLLNFTEKLTYSSATQVWPNSRSLYDFIRSKGMAPANKLQVIGMGSTNGIDLGRFSTEALHADRIREIKQGIGYSEQNQYLLFIGRLVKDKGIIEAVHVFIGLHETMPSLRLLLVGDYEPDLDPLPEETMNTIKTHPAIIHIAWTNEVEYYLHVAGYLLFPSHREGFPNVLLQAGAMGLPVICSRIEGNVDLVTERETGLIFAPANETEMRKCLQYALANPVLMKEMAAKLQQRISLHYRREKVWAHLLEAYRTLSH